MGSSAVTLRLAIYRTKFGGQLHETCKFWYRFCFMWLQLGAPSYVHLASPKCLLTGYKLYRRGDQHCLLELFFCSVVIIPVTTKFR